MKKIFIKSLFCMMLVFGFSTVSLAGDFSGGLIDPSLHVINKTNQAYTLKWEVRSSTMLNSDLSSSVKDHGLLKIKANDRKGVSADFFTTKPAKNSSGEANSIFLKLYDSNMNLVSQTGYVQKIYQKDSKLMLGKVDVIIAKDKALILIVHSNDKQKPSR